MTQTIHRFNLRNGGEALSFYLANRLEFESSSKNLWSKLKRSGIYLGDYGMLPKRYHESINQAGYVVYSFHTPIAWLVGNTWFVPNVTYSNSSTKHRNIMLDMLRAIAEESNLEIVSN